jgi:hypothetical protein
MSPHGLPPFSCRLAVWGRLCSRGHAGPISRGGTTSQKDFKGQAPSVSADGRSVWTDAVPSTHVRRAPLPAHAVRPCDVSTDLQASGSLVLILLAALGRPSVR